MQHPDSGEMAAALHGRWLQVEGIIAEELKRFHALNPQSTGDGPSGELAS